MGIYICEFKSIAHLIYNIPNKHLYVARMGYRAWLFECLIKTYR